METMLVDIVEATSIDAHRQTQYPGVTEAKEDADFLEGIGCTVLRFPQNGKYEVKGGLKADTLVFAGEEHKVDCVFIIKDTVSVTNV